MTVFTLNSDQVSIASVVTWILERYELLNETYGLLFSLKAFFYKDTNFCLSQTFTHMNVNKKPCKEKMKQDLYLVTATAL